MPLSPDSEEIAENGDKKAVKRNINTSGLIPFKKGQSGNPGGIRKASQVEKSMERRIRDKLGDLNLVGLREMQRILTDPQAKNSDKIAATRLVMEFSISKPPQAVEGKFEGAMIVLSQQMREYAE